MKYIVIILTLISGAIISSAVIAGQLDSSGVTSAGSGMPTLQGIFDQLDTGTPAPVAGSFQEPTSGPMAGTGKSLSDIKVKLPFPDNTNGAATGDVLNGKTFWGLRTDGTWGPKTGSMVPPAAPSGTATADKVLTGETFSNAGGTGLTGTMPDNGAVTITPGISHQPIAAGYHNGSGTVQGDANLIPGNIKSGVTIFGVAGSAMFSSYTGGCNLCHGVTDNGFPATGAHTRHIDVLYHDFPCNACHTGGMVGTADYDGKVQVGFNWAGFTGAGSTYNGNSPLQGFSYEAKNDTAVNTTGNKTCSNLYCHSMGLGKTYSFSTGTTVNRVACLTGALNGITNTTPEWSTAPVDPQGDMNICNNCHDNSTVPPGFAPFNNTFKAMSNYSSHWPHINAGMTCNNCHNETTTSTNNQAPPTNKSAHVNGRVEVKAGGVRTSAISFTYDPNTYRCSSITGGCHANRYWTVRTTMPTCTVTCADWPSHPQCQQ